MRQNREIPLKAKLKYAFFVEGKSEYWYIQMLKRNEKCNQIDLKPELPQKKKLSDQYARVKELVKDYHKVFWIVDFDVINKESREASKGITPLQKIKRYYAEIEKRYKDKIILLINNPAFEYWHLLHFIKTSRYYATCDEVIRVLKNHLPNYEKTEKYYTKQNSDIYLQLKPYLCEAIVNAKKLAFFDFDSPETGVAQMRLFFEMDEIKEVFGINLSIIP